MNDKLNELIELSRPIADFILHNYNPKSIVAISADNVKLLVDEMGGSFSEPPIDD